MIPADSADDTARQFVITATVLLLNCLSRDTANPFDPDAPVLVPTLQELLEDDRLVDFCMFVDRDDDQVRGALRWLDTFWLPLPDAERAIIAPAVHAEVARRRFEPIMPELIAAVADATRCLSMLARQVERFTDVSHLHRVVTIAERWLSTGQPREALLELKAAATSTPEPPDTPAGEFLGHLCVYAQEGMLLAPDYAALHFKAVELKSWDLDELTRLFRSRYPLISAADVAEIVDTLAAEEAARPPEMAEQGDW